MSIEIEVRPFEVEIDVDEICVQAGDECAELIRNNAKKGFGAEYSTGEYAVGWTWRVDHDKVGTYVTVFNDTQPKLSHLLELGHIIKNHYGSYGKWSPPKKHIQPAYDKIKRKYYENAKKAKFKLVKK